MFGQETLNRPPDLRHQITLQFADNSCAKCRTLGMTCDKALPCMLSSLYIDVHHTPPILTSTKCALFALRMATPAPDTASASNG